MSRFDDNALHTLTKVSEHFNAPLRRFEPILSDFSVGIEIEVKFRYYFPEIHDKYFLGKSWKEYSNKMQKAISKEISEEEKGLQDKLNKTLELGVKKGKDCYWEFALDPVNDLSILLTQIHLLRDIGVLPNGDHSLHMTIGELDNNHDAYWILFICEILLSSKERIESGFGNKNKTYFRKGVSGLFMKRWGLEGCKFASEFRSLELGVSEDISVTYDKLDCISKIINDDKFRKLEIRRCKSVLSEFGMPATNWKNYKDNAVVWDRYLDNFNDIKKRLYETV